MIWALCDLWRACGFEIKVLRGLAAHCDADLLIPHIDLTLLPAAYVALYDRYPRVVNRHLHDISKRVISRNLLAPTDNYAGEVIVKTNLNFGGNPEARMLAGPKTLRRRLADAFFPRKPSSSRDCDWSSVKHFNGSDYQIFSSLDKVPAGVFANDALVVERFLPEREDGLYHLRCYIFFGDQGYCSRVSAREPIVKGGNAIRREIVKPPAELLAIRRELQVDYGKLDFVLRDGRVVLLDLNRTPGTIKSPSHLKAAAGNLAPGINSFFG